MILECICCLEFPFHLIMIYLYHKHYILFFYIWNLCSFLFCNLLIKILLVFFKLLTVISFVLWTFCSYLGCFYFLILTFLFIFWELLNFYYLLQQTYFKWNEKSHFQVKSFLLIVFISLLSYIQAYNSYHFHLTSLKIIIFSDSFVCFSMIILLKITKVFQWIIYNSKKYYLQQVFQITIMLDFM